MALTKAPTPAPLVVQLPPTAGLAVAAQQTPLAVTAAPPSVVTVPPDVAPVVIIAVTAAVLTAGMPTVVVVNGRSVP